MALVAATLASELDSAMQIVDTEAEAITNFCGAFETYLYGASVTGITITTGALTSAISAMQSAMTGLSTAGSTAIAAGISAAWSTMAAAVATLWAIAPPATAMTPPTGLGSLASALDAVFASNTSGGLNRTAACTAIANVIHPLMLGAIATFPAPPTGIGPQPVL